MISTGAYITIYSRCMLKGRVHMPFSFREMIERVKYSKVKLYKGVDIDLKVSNRFVITKYFDSNKHFLKLAIFIFIIELG